jgi:hypothetical protein
LYEDVRVRNIYVVCTTQIINVEPIVAKAVAALHVVIFIKELGFSDTILEGDALQIIQEINSGRPNLSKIDHFVKSIQ